MSALSDELDQLDRDGRRYEVRRLNHGMTAILLLKEPSEAALARLTDGQLAALGLPPSEVAE